MFLRTRDIADGSDGACLRVSLNAHPAGTVVMLERRDQEHRPFARLSLHGAEILNGFVMAARLSTPQPIPDETTGQPCPARFRLECTAEPRVLVEQEDRFPLSIEARLWDRLYAELCLALAHGREQAQQHTYCPVASLH